MKWDYCKGGKQPVKKSNTNNHIKHKMGHTNSMNLSFTHEKGAVHNTCTPSTELERIAEKIVINKYAFKEQYRSLVTVEMQCSNIDLQKVTFSHCTSLTTVHLPEGIMTIEEDMFSHCYSLKLIELPSSVQKICRRAFLNCISLTSINLPSSMIEIGDKAFFNCESLKSIEFHSLKKIVIGNSAFSTCLSLESIDMTPLNIETIRYSSFSHCSSLKEILLSETTKVIESYSFQHCSSLTSIVIPSSVEHIDFGAFENCTSITYIKLPPSIEHIHKTSFQQCSSLVTINLPPKVTSAVDIPMSIFDGCGALASIKIESTISNLNTYSIRMFKDMVKLIPRMDQTQCSTNDSIPPLHLLLSFGHIQYYKDGIEKVIKEAPRILYVKDPVHNMHPFFLAACTPRIAQNNEKRRGIGTLEHMETLYAILRNTPWIIDDVLSK